LVVDNGSGDGTYEMVRERFAGVEIIKLPGNAGAAARTVGAEEMPTQYVAFCDDDCWWEAHSLAKAVEILDEHPRIAVLTPRVVLGNGAAADPASEHLGRRDERDGLPGQPVLYFTPGACIVRRDIFLLCGGYDPRLLVGEEETLLAIDLATRGWALRYVDDVLVHHDPSPLHRDREVRRRRRIRNRLWIAWLRFSLPSAWRHTRHVLERSRRDRVVRGALLDALGGVHWVLHERRPVSKHLQERIDAVPFAELL
jgi:GT2 family glycosyltransferase